MFGLKYASDAGVESRLGGLGNAQRDAAMQVKEVLDVDGSYKEGDAAETYLNCARDTDQEKHIQPGRHESKIHQAADEDERSGDEGHLPPILKIDEQRQQKEQHPHRAGIKSIQQPDDDGEQRKAEVLDAKLTEPGRLDTL